MNFKYGLKQCFAYLLHSQLCSKMLVGYINIEVHIVNEIHTNKAFT